VRVRFPKSPAGGGDGASEVLSVGAMGKAPPVGAMAQVLIPWGDRGEE